MDEIKTKNEQTAKRAAQLTCDVMLFFRDNIPVGGHNPHLKLRSCWQDMSDGTYTQDEILSAVKYLAQKGLINIGQGLGTGKITQGKIQLLDINQINIFAVTAAGEDFINACSKPGFRDRLQSAAALVNTALSIAQIFEKVLPLINIT